MRPDIAKVDEAVDRSQHMVDGHMPLERQLVKQSSLIDLPLTHHHLHPRCENWSESVKQPQRNLSLLQQNRSYLAIALTSGCGLLSGLKRKKDDQEADIGF